MDTKRLKRGLQIVVAASFVALATTAQVRAVSIYSNAITDTNPGAANPYTNGQVVDANITASGIGAGSGVTNTSASNRFNFANWNLTALDTNDYISWTMAPNSGKTIDFNALTGNWQRSGTGPSNYALRSSLDGFTANITTGTISGSGSAVAFNLPISGASFDAISSAVTFKLFAWGTTGAMNAGTFSINDFAFDGAINTTVAGNNSAITGPASTALNRVMLHQTPSTNFNLTKTGSDATTYTATPSSAGIAVTASGSIAGGSQSESIGVQLQNVALGSGSPGTKSYSVMIDNTAATSAASGQGAADADDTVNVTATVVDNRTITASPVNLGNVIKGAITLPATSALTTTGDDNNFTRVTVNGTTATDGSVTVAVGANQPFNGAASTTNRSVSGVFATAGAKSGAVVLSTTGEALTGEAVNPVAVNYTANVYDPSSAAFASNDGTTISVNFGTVQQGSGVHSLNEAIYNVLQTAGFTAGLDFDSIAGTGNTGTLFTDLVASAFTNLTAGVGNAYGFSMKFDANSPVGVYSATYDLGFSDSNLYTGASAPGSQHLTLNLSGTVVPESGWTVLIVLVIGLPVMAVCRRSLA